MCNCGTCQTCVNAKNSITPQYNNGGNLPAIINNGGGQPTMTFEQFNSGQHNTSPPVISNPPPINNNGGTSEPIIATSATPIVASTISDEDEFVFKEMSPWEIIFWSIDNPYENELV